VLELRRSQAKRAPQQRWPAYKKLPIHRALEAGRESLSQATSQRIPAQTEGAHAPGHLQRWRGRALSPVSAVVTLRRSDPISQRLVQLLPSNNQGRGARAPRHCLLESVLHQPADSQPSGRQARPRCGGSVALAARLAHRPACSIRRFARPPYTGTTRRGPFEKEQPSSLHLSMRTRPGYACSAVAVALPAAPPICCCPC
jgi:hypothetical protein